MAITVRTPQQTGGAERKQNLRRGMALGLGLEITLGATADYGAGGIDLVALKSKLGFTQILGVLNAFVRTSANALRPVLALYDVTTGKLRLYVSSAPAAQFTEITAGTDLAAGDIVSLDLYGVP